jgi:uncharacterized protein (TIGR02300 family)
MENRVSNPEWGMKRICPNCGTRYYDFLKTPPACPVCATVYDPEALLKSRRSKALPPDEPVKKKKIAAAAVLDDLPLDATGDEALEPELDDEDVGEVEADPADAVEDNGILEDDADDLDDEIEEVEVEDDE